MDQVRANDGKMKALYGFVAWIATHIFFALFLAWAYIPDSTLASMGITWYPDKYWALAVPSFFLVSIFAFYVLHWKYTRMNVAPLESLSTLVDEFSNFPDTTKLRCALASIPELLYTEYWAGHTE